MEPRSELDAITARLDTGDTLNAIAADLGVTERTIRNRLQRAGLPSASSRSRDRRRARLDDAAWLCEQHLDRSQSPSAIAHTLGVPTVEVRAALDRFDIAHPAARPELTAEALRAAFAAGETVSSIARRAGIDRSGVRQRMRRHGIENPHAHRGRCPALLDDPDWLRRRYVDDVRSIEAIGAEVARTGRRLDGRCAGTASTGPRASRSGSSSTVHGFGRCMRWIDCLSPRSPSSLAWVSARSTGEGLITESRSDRVYLRPRVGHVLG